MNREANVRAVVAGILTIILTAAVGGMMWVGSFQQQSQPPPQPQGGSGADNGGVLSEVAQAIDQFGSYIQNSLNHLLGG